MRLNHLFAISALLIATSCSNTSSGALKITSPKDGAIVSEKVNLCFEISGYWVEPAKNGIGKIKGHHHILIDTPIPADLKKPIGSGTNIIHMGDGSHCRDITLAKGEHTIRGLFANGGHIPYDPPITDVVKIIVK